MHVWYDEATLGSLVLRPAALQALRSLEPTPHGINPTFGHHPTDSTLLNDGVRMLSRALGHAQTRLPPGPAVAQDTSTDSTPQARDKMKRIMEVARQKGEAAAERLTPTYCDLIDLITTVVARTKHGPAVLTAQTTATAQRVAGMLDQFLPPGEQVITPTTRRVLGASG